MQTLRKKTSPLKYKNETTRFLGDGVSFKAKLIGILEVSEARGDRMCQEALSDLKMAIRAAGEHKQRITINIAIDGLRLRDEKTGDSLYHHPVHKISFIAQDMTDSRAFGYIFGSPDTGHRFFGIKTDKAASQVVIAMRDLFQVVFALKKKEIELAKQHLDKTRFTSSPLFSDSSLPGTKAVSQESTKSTAGESKAGASSESKSGGTAVADLVDLELELNSLQQGLNQMERITPSDPFGSKDDPFGDSFTNYTKPILPPPPSSGRERSSRASETSLFSPRTPLTAGGLDSSTLETSLLGSKDRKSRKEFTFSQDFSSSREEPSSGDWFTPSAGNSIFEEGPALVPEPTKEEKHELAKQEILSQFDVFTELDPLELKNPPKKVLKDLVSQTQPPPSSDQNHFNATFNQTMPKMAAAITVAAGDFTTDPFGEDPFVTEDPFAEADFTKQDPFEAEFRDFKGPAGAAALNDLDKYKVDARHKTDHLQTSYQTNLSRSPKSSMLATMSTSPKTVQFVKQNSFDVQFDKFEHKMAQLHDNPSLDVSSESECAPEPPPRPASTLMQIKPPPLPPKKQANDLSIKPPPRPPHADDSSHYDYMDNYETAPNSLEYVVKGVEKSPPLPVPARKTKFESDFGASIPLRPRKQFNVQSSEEDYLTPISFPECKVEPKKSSGILLPPPQRAGKKQAAAAAAAAAATAVSNLNVGPNNLSTSFEGLDITLSQLTLSGLNELAAKLNIPANQLSNMTLVQLTNYLSNFIKSKSRNVTPPNALYAEANSNSEFPAFKADFAANFNNVNSTATGGGVVESYDRYAVFRELMKEEIKQTKIDTEPEELQEEKEKLASVADENVTETTAEADTAKDKYAALREIVESELKVTDSEPKDDNKNEPETIRQHVINEAEVEEMENRLNNDDKEKGLLDKYSLIEYNTPLDTKDIKTIAPLKSPKSPVSRMPIKSPVPAAVTEIVQNSARLNSGSLSDVISGSSPEIDNTASNSEAGKKTEDATGETWAIFDQGHVPSDSVKDKQAVQSEEGVSPWSSDSKEFGNGSPPDWRRGDSGSGGDHWPKRRGRRDQEGWWDTSAEPEMQYYPSNRRSTDSYEEEYYECYERPTRRRKQTAAYSHGGQGAVAGAGGGHSSSSRDVSPWEEEPRRRELREPRPGWPRHPRQHSFEKLRDRRHTDSWDEEDDYEYEEEHVGRYHRPDRHRDGAERDRHSAGSREQDSDRWTDDWNDDRRHRRRREGGDRERWCCPDWEQEKPARYVNKCWSNPDARTDGSWRDRKHDDRYYSRESQESPWEDDYSNDADDVPPSHFLTAKRNWKRPSSASEMDRKTGEIKSRHYLGTGGSDGERDRRYKPGRRSRSRDSQYSEPVHRHKPESAIAPPRNPHRNTIRQHLKAEFDDSHSAKKVIEIPKLSDHSNKKSATLATRKKTKDSPKSEENVVSTFPRKSTSRSKSLFENDFIPSSDVSPATMRLGAKFNFENYLETSEAESPTVFTKGLKGLRQQSMFEKSQSSLDGDFSKDSYRQRSLRLSPRVQTKAKSLFEDDFSPGDKPEPLPEDNSISSIKEEIDPNEEDDSFNTNNFEHATNSRKKKFNKHRLSNSLHADVNIKKSESVNIFARENDPFDDDFFSENAALAEGGEGGGARHPRHTDLKWTDDFEDFDGGK